jgi:NAD(P)-dependent dehydrogenase (short-subunit alcohol dehydrogenase family)
MNFNNKVYIITGTNSGIGKSCAEMLLKKDAMVIGLDMKENTIIHSAYRHYVVDITDVPKIEDAFKDIKTRYLHIDGLANCAGIFATCKPFYELDLEEWNRVIETNLTGSFLVSKYVSHWMIQQNFGRIVNISCIRSKILRSNMADYAASKGGIATLTSAMAMDLAPYNIRVNCVAPGFTYTGMTSQSFSDPRIRNASEDIIPVGRIAEPEDIANVVLFLLSDLSDYINGETIFADGGYKIYK